MKSFSRTIIALAILSLLMGTVGLATQARQGRMSSYTISGTVGLRGVVMHGLPGNPVSDENGNYEAVVKRGWSGTVTPTRQGHTFTPPRRTYEAVYASQANQNYAGEVRMLTISDVITIGGKPVQGVRVSADNIGVSDVTDAKGRYILQVPYGWSGEITLSKEGYRFDPPGRSFTKVTTDIVGADTRRLGRRSRASRRMMTTGYVPPFVQTGRRRTLIVPTSEIKQEELLEVEQDMRVMAHILDKRFREPRMIRGMFEDYGDFFGRDSRDTEAIYIQDYGALFLMEANLPFSRTLGPDQKQVEAPEEPVDTAWEQAKREVSLSADLGSRRPDRADKSDAERVEDFKRELIESLKHAANIRNLSSDEWIIVTVVGGALPSYSFVEYGGPISVPVLPENSETAPAESGFEAGARAGRYGMAGGAAYGGRVSGGYGGFGGGFSGGFGGGYGGYGLYGGGYLGMPSPSSAVLIIRVKKADVDDFASGGINLAAFREQVQSFTY